MGDNIPWSDAYTVLVFDPAGRDVLPDVLEAISLARDTGYHGPATVRRIDPAYVEIVVARQP